MKHGLNFLRSKACKLKSFAELKKQKLLYFLNFLQIYKNSQSTLRKIDQFSHVESSNFANCTTITETPCTSYKKRSSRASRSNLENEWFLSSTCKVCGRCIFVVIVSKRVLPLERERDEGPSKPLPSPVKIPFRPPRERDNAFVVSRFFKLNRVSPFSLGAHGT